MSVKVDFDDGIRSVTVLSSNLFLNKSRLQSGGLSQSVKRPLDEIQIVLGQVFYR